MNIQEAQIIASVFKKSNRGEIHFGQVLEQLISIDVESYTVDYRRGETTYYLKSDKTIRHVFENSHFEIAEKFDATGIKNAILAAQSGSVMYPEFKKITMEAGCVGYIVLISGKNVQYFGRLGEIHLEKFI